MSLRLVLPVFILLMRHHTDNLREPHRDDCCSDHSEIRSFLQSWARTLGSLCSVLPYLKGGRSSSPKSGRTIWRGEAKIAVQQA
ncbi:hypothetical protein B0J13DRAFT_547142 [Dactylonectria estremocensis]|uniref:Secreted protein n=1 Tax=Dactylonectria estremocensis TaxID=1079267 RepID=A0A9P9F4D4_9HYPO|nr:hypothetical protein B0J13DRAFT_547142 [Dactylonectria estremocensis]